MQWKLPADSGIELRMPRRKTDARSRILPDINLRLRIGFQFQTITSCPVMDLTEGKSDLIFDRATK